MSRHEERAARAAAAEEAALEAEEHFHFERVVGSFTGYEAAVAAARAARSAWRDMVLFAWPALVSSLACAAKFCFFRTLLAAPPGDYPTGLVD